MRKNQEMGKLSQYRIRSLLFSGIGFLVCAVLLIGCAQAPVIRTYVDRTKLVDGIFEGHYRGGPNKATVKVTIKNNRIVKIEIVEHRAWKGRKAGLPIVERIISSQSTHVDAVSGATNSSRVIINAVQNAIEKSYQN